MSTKDDGGPAYPALEYSGSAHAGMSLRDAFAIAALQGFAAADREDEHGHVDLARAAYRQADAMLEARK